MADKVSDEYEYLYHYTDFKGLCGILDDKCLWATHFRFLNDESELQLFKEELKKYLEPIVREEYKKFIDQDPNAKTFLKNSNLNFDQMVQHETNMYAKLLCNSYGTNKNDGMDSPIYITSFSGESKTNETNQNEDGFLSMWRSYGRDGGFAIILNTTELERSFKKEVHDFSQGGVLGRAVYSHQHEVFQQEFSEGIEHIKNYVRDMIKSGIYNNEPEELPGTEDAFKAVISCMSRFKHQGFVEENEVRAVILRHDTTEGEQEIKEIHFRESDGYKIPYIKLFEDQRLPIAKIIVGPHKDKEKRAAFLITKLKGTGIEVTVSDIPYIG
ncbi:MAG: hypothetical protein COB14_09220 [Alphaproteobacteria bacterium]|nr:MAG: hypothetical protein COB14_09220 [Alphaproteobacteria bacterium]